MENNNKESKNISILGCGWYGLELAKVLVQNGYRVNGSTTTVEKVTLLKQFNITPFIVDFKEDKETFNSDFFKCVTLIICIPPKRTTSEQHSFVNKIQRIAAAAAKQRVKHVLFISSISVYGDHNEIVSETTIPQPSTASGKAMVSAEVLLKNHTEFVTTVLRFGGLFGPGRDPGRFFAGKKAIPNGRAPVNLIHLNDCIGITLQILETNAYGHIYNACAPSHIEKADFYTRAALASGLKEPEFIDELLNWKLVTNINSEKFLNYQFTYNFL